MHTFNIIFIFSLNILFIYTFSETGLEDDDRECIKTLNLTVSFVINSFDKYNLLLEGNEEVNKFVNCTWTRLGYLTKNGIINPDALMKWIEKDIIKMDNNQTESIGHTLVNPCKSIKGEDSGDTAVKIPNAKAFSENDFDETDLHCLKELNIDKKVIIESYDDNDFIKEGNSQMNAFFTCGWKKDQLQAADGSINFTNLQSMIDYLLEKRKGVKNAKDREHLAKQGVDHCKDVKGDDHGIICVKMYNCLLKHIGELIQQ
ncbi:hypothetical protein RN001_013920 [Aquatica leii]|uniref:Uncharacterized protein n=1 Tax=Aquatica leii TaxID=1421715 RepID=A0AAN7SNX3_9COLE|nr:hypothetical protein RN001_013920 [Aquatica leii]